MCEKRLELTTLQTPYKSCICIYHVKTRRYTYRETQEASFKEADIQL